MELKTFKDLPWKAHPLVYGRLAKLEFDNGWGVSVVGGVLCADDDRQYELAVIKNGKLHYDNFVANGDVQSYLTEEEVSELMIEVQNLPPRYSTATSIINTGKPAEKPNKDQE